RGIRRRDRRDPSGRLACVLACTSGSAISVDALEVRGECTAASGGQTKCKCPATGGVRRACSAESPSFRTPRLAQCKSPLPERVHLETRVCRWIDPFHAPLHAG